MWRDIVILEHRRDLTNLWISSQLEQSRAHFLGGFSVHTAMLGYLLVQHLGLIVFAEFGVLAQRYLREFFNIWTFELDVRWHDILQAIDCFLVYLHLYLIIGFIL